MLLNVETTLRGIELVEEKHGDLSISSTISKAKFAFLACKFLLAHTA